MGWFENNTGLSDIATSTDFGIPEERRDDVDDVSDQFSSVCIGSESLVAATETVIKQVTMPVTHAEQLRLLMEAFFGHSSFQLKQEQAINIHACKKRIHLL